jgi:hypothetical protein
MADNSSPSDDAGAGSDPADLGPADADASPADSGPVDSGPADSGPADADASPASAGHVGGPADAFEAAVTAAVEAAGAAGAAPDAAAVANARERARQMVAADGPGLRELRQLALSLGGPVARVLLGAVAADNNAARAEIESACIDGGCMRVDFHDRLAGRPDVAVLALGACPRDHDLSAQLEPFRARCAPEKWADVLRHLGTLVSLGRHAHAVTARSLAPLLRRLAPPPRLAGLFEAHVDPANTTLVLDADAPVRVGIFVHVGAAAVNAAGATRL